LQHIVFWQIFVVEDLYKQSSCGWLCQAPRYFGPGVRASGFLFPVYFIVGVFKLNDFLLV
jgi:hypothetical protein